MSVRDIGNNSVCKKGFVTRGQGPLGIQQWQQGAGSFKQNQQGANACKLQGGRKIIGLQRADDATGKGDKSSECYAWGQTRTVVVLLKLG